MRMDDGARVRAWMPPGLYDYTRGNCQVEWGSGDKFVGHFSFNTLVELAMQILEQCQGRGGVERPKSRGGDIIMTGLEVLDWYVTVTGVC